VRPGGSGPPNKKPGPDAQKETAMKKTAPKKLTLNRETLGALNDQEMLAIQGGAARPTTNSVDVCCA
jgi:hypothetical protein